MKNISLGQYYPGSSVMYRLDPRMKLIMAFVYILSSFLARNVISFGLLLISSVLLILISRIPMSMILNSIKPILVILAFTVFINIFLTQGETLLFEWKFIHIYFEGIMNALFMMIRIFVLIIGASLFLTYTTTPIALTDAIEQLFAPLKKIKVPVHEFAMMMTIALRFIPTLMDETDKIMSAQKARGADFTSGSLIHRAKALIPILIPLFVSAFRRADELATAMECRCYHGGEGRTRMSILRYKPRDFAALALMMLFCAALVAVNYIKFGYSM